jgi:transposase
MMIIGVDYHPSFQAIAFKMEETGECGEQELNHSDGQAEKFYRDLKQRGICVRVGMEATGYSRWFERLLAELGFEVWMGDPAEIKAKRVKKQKFDRDDAAANDRYANRYLLKADNRVSARCRGCITFPRLITYLSTQLRGITH